MIRAVFFDVGGTLIHPWPSVGVVYSRVGRQFGLSASDAAMDQAFRVAWRRNKGLGKLTTSDKEWWRKLVDETLATLKVTARDGYFEALYETFAQAEAWQVYPDVVEALHVVRTRGMYVGVISNWDERLRPLLDCLNLSQFFDSITVSCEVGVEKPDMKIFHAALQTAQINPVEACHIGDSVDEDQRGAEAVGMRGLVLDRTATGCGLQSLLTALE